MILMGAQGSFSLGVFVMTVGGTNSGGGFTSGSGAGTESPGISFVEERPGIPPDELVTPRPELDQSNSVRDLKIALMLTSFLGSVTTCAGGGIGAGGAGGMELDSPGFVL